MASDEAHDYTMGVAQKLIAVAQIWRREIARALADEGVSDAMVLPLVHLQRDGDGIRQGILAEQVGVDNTSIVRVLDGLEKGGLIQRSEDPSDRRAKLIHLTTEGRALASHAEKTLARIRAEFLADCAREEILGMSRTLDRMLETMRRPGIAGLTVPDAGSGLTESNRAPEQ